MKTKYYKNKLSETVLEDIAMEIRNGKNVIFPTETVYGIGTNAFNEKACKKIFEIKGRPNNKPLIVLISDFSMLDNIVEDVNEIEYKLMKTFWPGPLTIIFKKNKNNKISTTVTAGKDDIGIRMTNGQIARLLIQKANVPIVAPSANLSGKPTGTKIKEIIKDFNGKADYILDFGDVQDETTSTVVKVENNRICIIRHGKITEEELSNIAKIKECE